jgi:hypothetical protein
MGLSSPANPGGPGACRSRTGRPCRKIRGSANRPPQMLRHVNNKKSGARQIGRPRCCVTSIIKNPFPKVSAALRRSEVTMMVTFPCHWGGSRHVRADSPNGGIARASPPFQPVLHRVVEAHAAADNRQRHLTRMAKHNTGLLETPLAKPRSFCGQGRRAGPVIRLRCPKRPTPGVAGGRTFRALAYSAIAARSSRQRPPTFRSAGRPAPQ